MTQVRPDGVEPEALVLTHWFDPGEAGPPYPATLRLTGRRVGSRGSPKPRDTFMHEESIEAVVPGSGPVSVTSRVYGLQPGEWTVTADLLRRARQTGYPQRRGSETIPRGVWSWRRWSVSTAPPGSVKTIWAQIAPLVGMPAVIPGIWLLLGALGIAVALATQAALLTQRNVPVGPSLAASLMAIAAGVIGAKLWYGFLHPGPWRKWILGWAADGFLVVGFVVAVAGLLSLGLPVGVVLDSSTPGLFLAVAVGRLGCFFAGCCSGRCTSSRWGIWSSDRTLGARRVPAQLLEAAAGLAIGVAAAVPVLGHAAPYPGLVFVASFAAYLLVRQSLLRIRAEPRKFSWLRSAAASRAGP